MGGVITPGGSKAAARRQQGGSKGGSKAAARHPFQALEGVYSGVRSKPSVPSSSPSARCERPQNSQTQSKHHILRPSYCCCYGMRTRQARLSAEAAAAPAEESSESFLDHFTGKRVSLILVDGTLLSHAQLRAQIKRPLKLMQAEAWLFAQQSPGMKRQREASLLPLGHMLTEFSPCVLVRLMLGCVATACRRLAITPAGVIVSCRTTGRWAGRTMDHVTRGRVRRVQVQP